MFEVSSKYSEETVKPMREELTDAGVEEILTVEAVDGAINSTDGSTLLIINSVCGCAA